MGQDETAELTRSTAEMVTSLNTIINDLHGAVELLDMLHADAQLCAGLAHKPARLLGGVPTGRPMWATSRASWSPCAR